MTTARRNPVAVALRLAPPLLVAAALIGFGLREPRFLAVENLVNILVQSSAVAIVAGGLTFVLISGGIDLSVGSAMFLAAVAAGKLALAGFPALVAPAAVVLVGLLCGAANGLLVTRLGLLPFIATLGTLSIGRGLGLFATETRAMNLPDDFLALGAARFLGLPAPVWLMFGLLGLGQAVLSLTPAGRQLYAVGHDPAAAAKAGVRVGRVLMLAYLAAGLGAAFGGLVVVTQLAAVSPALGQGWEFDAIAAAVLGGASLSGGRGRVLPGTLYGAVLIQAIRNGLNLSNADPYLYPVVLGSVIFLAVFLDSARAARLRSLRRRTIRA